ncbi:hypothetical protein BA895_16475 [Humibacillus sp. DSM 29435]|uniref:DUF1622 domain-containing protein n=1 Tax=Humibacillus sp. DSM 29435 TaxID=1869167 RepID=UPI00087318A6|nr:DUF1622 domain-containing protein [Humibacillus sp. DSM 29435]OFE17377.1 hypothetical protein BA895_16475 [Humibacillus sp. DSM 29435]
MSFDELVQAAGQVMEAAGVLAVLLGTLMVAGQALGRLARHEPAVYVGFRQGLGRSILLGLELLVAADIVRTVATRPTLASVTVLAAIVLIRSFLSLALELEVTGRWPWQPRSEVRPEVTGR